jgi:uncharacterized cupredoxin-like copper-binding protein
MIKKMQVALLVMPAFLAGWSQIADSHEHHSNYSAGEPGDPKKPSRELTVEMSEMDYSPSVIDVKRGEQIKFLVSNIGTEDHEFVLASTKDNLKHAAAMRKHPGMAHDEPNGLRLARKQSGEILWKFTKAGTFEYSCLISLKATRQHRTTVSMMGDLHSNDGVASGLFSGRRIHASRNIAVAGSRSKMLL